MAILVDPICQWPSGRWCHLMSDLPGQAGLDELHTFARRLGLKVAWFQDRPRYPHYDLRPSKRELAIRLGAQAVEAIELIRRCRQAPVNTDDLPSVIVSEPLVPTPDGLEAGRYTGLFTDAEIAKMTPTMPVLPKRIREMHNVYGRAADGLTCATCVHLERHKQSSHWLKCGRSAKTGSSASDWRAGWPACGLHKPVEESTDAR